jgi:hypothetical protein
MHRVDGLGSDVSKYRVTISRPAADGSPPKNGTRPASARRDRATARSPWSCPPRLRTCAPSVPRGPLRALPSQVRGPVPPLLRHLSTPRFVSPHSPKFDVCGDTNTGVLGPRGETAVVGGVVSRETAPRSFGQGSAPVDRLTGEWGMGRGRFRTSGPTRSSPVIRIPPVSDRHFRLCGRSSRSASSRLTNLPVDARSGRQDS